MMEWMEMGSVAGAFLSQGAQLLPDGPLERHGLTHQSARPLIEPASIVPELDEQSGFESHSNSLKAAFPHASISSFVFRSLGRVLQISRNREYKRSTSSRSGLASKQDRWN